MDGCQDLHRLQFHDDPILDQEVHPESFRERRPAISDLHRHLPCHPKPPGSQFGRQGRLVNALKQARPHFPMHSVGGVHHLLRQFVLHIEDYVAKAPVFSALPSRLGVFA